MANLSQIKTDSNWGTEAPRINENFNAVNAELAVLRSTTSVNIPLFSSLSEAQQSIPNPYIGKLILVGTTLPAAVYKWDGTKWYDTGITGGETNVSLEDYYTKAENDTKFSELDKYIISLDLSIYEEIDVTPTIPIVWDGAKVTITEGYKSFILRVHPGDIITANNSPSSIKAFSGNINIGTGDNFVESSLALNGDSIIPQGINYLLVSYLNSNVKVTRLSKYNSLGNIINKINSYTENEVINTAIKEMNISDSGKGNNTYELLYIRKNWYGAEDKWLIWIKRSDGKIFQVYSSKEKPNDLLLINWEKENYDDLNNTIKVMILIDWTKLHDNSNLTNIKISDIAFDFNFSPTLYRIYSDIDNTVKKLKDDVESVSSISKNYIDNYRDGYINNDKEIGEIVSLKPASSPEFKCSVYDCKEGDIFYITGAGSYAGTLWTFIDSENRIISKAEKNTNIYKDLKCVAPKYSAKIIVNFYLTITEDCYYYSLITDIFGYVDSKVKSDLYGKRIVCLGDSITEFKDGIGKRYSDYLAELSGAIVYNAGIGGAQLRVRGEVVELPSTDTQAYAALDVPSIADALAEGDWTKQLEAAKWLRENSGDDNVSIIEALNGLSAKDVDIITIFAGTNNAVASLTPEDTTTDFGTAGVDDVKKLMGALSHIIMKLLVSNPKLRIFVFTPIVRYFGEDWSSWDDSYFSDNKSNLIPICKKIIETCKYYHLPVCDMYYELGCNRYNWSTFFSSITDGTHPYNGFSAIANKMLSFIVANKNF